MSLFRERLLGEARREATPSPRSSWRKLLAWRHPGFSAHVGEPIAPEDKQRLEDTAAYLVRNPLSLKKLVYLDGEKAVVYRSRMNPSLGPNFEAMDPLEWLARLSDHIPDPGQHRTLFYGEYSSRVRGSGRARPSAEAAGRGAPAAQAQLAQLGAADRQGLPGRPARLHPLRPAHEHHRVRDRPDWRSGKILDHLGLSTPEAEKPPPPVREILRVAEHGDGWGVPADWD